MALVLILDDDLGFVFWLGHALATDFQPFPAPSVPEARKLLRRLRSKVDILILNPLVPGAAAFARSLRRKQRRLVVIATVENIEDLDAVLPEVNAARNKPTLLDEVAMTEWRQLVRQLLSSPRHRPRRASASDGAGD